MQVLNQLLESNDTHMVRMHTLDLAITIPQEAFYYPCYSIQVENVSFSAVAFIHTSLHADCSMDHTRIITKQTYPSRSPHIIMP